MNRAILALGGGLLALAVFILINSLQGITGDTNDTTYSNRNGNHTPHLLENDHVNSVPAKSERRKDGVVSKRSKAWILAREVEQCFPDPSSVVITKADYNSVESERKVPAQANLTAEKWRILGYTNDSGLEPLTILNTREGAHKLFAGIYAETGDESFSTESSYRSLVVNLLASENKQYSHGAPETTGGSPNLPFIFDLTVYQRENSGGSQEPK